LDEEMAEYLGYDKHEPVGRNRGNSRNGKRAKTVLTDSGEVDVEVPRDRDGSFEPVIVAKRQRDQRTPPGGRAGVAPTSRTSVVSGR
jgi:transposase-like protein